MIERAAIFFAVFGTVIAIISAIAVFARDVRNDGEAEERAKLDAENAARLRRQDAVENKLVSREQLQKSLEDGTF